MFQIDFHNWNLSTEEVHELAYNASTSNTISDMDCKGIITVASQSCKH